MNERFETLTKAAGYDTITKAYMKALGFNPEKFAELIVCECAKVASDFVRGHGGDHGVRQAVQEHFGIK